MTAPQESGAGDSESEAEAGRPTATIPPEEARPGPDSDPLSRALHSLSGDGTAHPQEATAEIDPQRFRKLRRFLLRTFLMAFWQDFLLNRPLLSWLRSEPLPRWRKVARRYRTLAVELGGVLIKLGQFLSIRVDILPAEVLAELAGLQDEVPPETYADVVAQVEADFGAPLGRLFQHFDPQPLGAASLAQVHAARLPPSIDEETSPGNAPASSNGPQVLGQEVVVKVLRPGIATLVETDLKALGMAVRWLRPWKRLARRVDLDRLAREVADTTRAELDLVAEGQNAERFAHDFAEDPGVRVPQVYWRRTARRTLTLENVAYLKIGDLDALDAAGISRRQLAKSLYRTYMRQIFVHDFVHSDPHPGNLFVRPLPYLEATEADAAHDVADDATRDDGTAVGFEGRPFELIFIDFGMVASVPPRLRSALREYLFGLGTRDAERVVQSYQAAGVLLPGADLARLVEVHEDLFQRLWGVSMGELRDTAFSEARYFLREYRDLVYELPFQVQVDLLFVSRAVGMLAGLATRLDDNFDPWSETLPFAESLAREELSPGLGALARELADQARVALRLPARLDDVLTRLERGTLTVQSPVSPEVRRLLGRLERNGRRLTWTVAAAGLLLSGVVLRALQPADPMGLVLLGGAGLAFLWSLLRYWR